MTTQPKHIITVFEHTSLKVKETINGVVFDASKLKALQTFYGDMGVPYFNLIHNGVKFTEYVGVLQVGDLTLEILPKADKYENKTQWRNLLIGMLQAAGIFDIQAPSTSSLNLKANSILDLYFAMFIEEVEQLLHRGLIKNYRKTESNSTSLKGSLQFGQHIQRNVVHQERFYVRHTIYDVQHQLHQILYKTLLLLKRINTTPTLQSKIGALMLNFPEQQDLKVSDATFDKIIYTRKTESYRKAIDIAKLLLLNYHPDINRGKNHVLALMFDMNMLWERFVYASLRKGLRRFRPNFTIADQTFKYFWKPESGYRSKIIPDIVINKNKPHCVVLDTKWKNLSGYNPSPDDLRQLYVYHEYYNAEKVALIYPGAAQGYKKGSYLHCDSGNETKKECSIISLAVKPSVKAWQESIYKEFEDWLNVTDLETRI